MIKNHVRHSDPNLLKAMYSLKSKKTRRISTISCTGLWFKCHTAVFSSNHSQVCEHVKSTQPAIPMTCHFTNVCLINSTVVVYNPDSSPILDLFKDVLLYRDSSTGHTKDRLLGFRIVKDSADIVSNWDTVPAVASEGVAYHNIGHIWGDAIWPTFQILYTFGADKKDFQLVLFQNIQEYMFLYSKISSSISYASSTPKCFANLYAGNDPILGYSHGTPNPQALSHFRDFVMRRMNTLLKTNTTSSNNSSNMQEEEEPSILFLDKNKAVADHKSVVSNIVEAVGAARVAFPLSSISTVSWHGMPLEEQFRIMVNADIVVTLPGSDLMNGLVNCTLQLPLY